MGTPLGPPPGPHGTGLAPGGAVVSPGPPAGAPGPGHGGQVRRWGPLAVLVAAALAAGGLAGGLLTGRGGRAAEPSGAAGPGPAAPDALAAAAGALDLDVRVTYCAPGEISGWAQGMAVNRGAEVVDARITVTFGHDDGTVLGEARADVVALGPGEAVNWRAGSGPPGEFDSCAVTAVEPA